MYSFWLTIDIYGKIQNHELKSLFAVFHHSSLFHQLVAIKIFVSKVFIGLDKQNIWAKNDKYFPTHQF